MCRRGLTRTELVIVLVLVLTGAGLVLTFINRGQERAGQVHCTENLRRIGLGIYGYHGLELARQKPLRPGTGALPPARIAPGYSTWAPLVVPYLQAGSPLEKWDSALPFAQQQEELRDTMVPVFLCPARPRKVWISPGGADGSGGAVGDYACAAGDGDPRFDWTGPEANGPMILGEVLKQDKDRLVDWRSRTTLESLLRGTSATILIGEKHVPLDQLGVAAIGDGPLYDGTLAVTASRIGGPGHPLADDPYGPVLDNFGSSHPGGCNFLFADGAAKPLLPTIEPAILARLLRRGE